MSTIKVDTVRPVTADASLTLQGDNSGTGVTGITIDSSGNAAFAQNAKVDTIRPNTTDASLTLQGDSSGSGVTGLTIDSSGNTALGGVLKLQSVGNLITLSDGTTAVLSESSGVVTLASGVAGTMSRKVFAKLSGNQTVTPNTATEVQFLDTESGCFDLDNTFASNRYTPTQSGYYYVNATITFDLSADTKVSYAYIYKNGSAVEQNRSRAGFDTSNRVDGIIYMNGSTDYLSIYGQHNDTADKVVRSDMSRLLIFFCP
jgi:hypothetical protein